MTVICCNVREIFCSLCNCEPFVAIRCLICHKQATATAFQLCMLCYCVVNYCKYIGPKRVSISDPVYRSTHAMFSAIS